MLSDFIKSAEESCSNGRVFNLILQGEFPIAEIDSTFVRVHTEKAVQWQARERPESLIINHGEYIHKYGDAIEYVIDELKRKPDSNRAVISLINCKDILHSGDRPIPSFMIFQFSFKSHQCIVCTAYFRALEVSKFLPSNIAEICLILREIKEKIPSIEQVMITIHAFSAYSNKDFYCLEVSEIDLDKNKGAIAIAVAKQDYVTISSLLQSKLRDESYVNTNGITELQNALRLCSDNYDRRIISNIGACLLNMKRLQRIRRSSSHSHEVLSLNQKIQTILSDTIKILHETIRGRS
ncbi:MAG: thymidylate synthase [Desulfovibrionales bacterium]|nr:thymidylate synthase [Desulfovibrionales bacterium]